MARRGNKRPRSAKGIGLLRTAALNSTPANWVYPLSLCLLGAYANLVAYGFQYPAGSDYNFVLPMANWLRKPIALSWRSDSRCLCELSESILADSGRGVEILEHGACTIFLARAGKLIFFLGIGRLVAAGVPNRLFGVCIVIVLALSGVLNSGTPIGHTGILSKWSEQGPLGLPILLLAGVFLVEGRWLSAAVTAGLAVYVDAIQFLHTLPAFAIFAVLDWRQRKRRIVAAAVVGAGIFVPWFVHSYPSLAVSIPKEYISALLIHYPYHITLRWTSFSSLLAVGAIIAGMCAMGFVGEKGGLAAQTVRLKPWPDPISSL